MDTLDTIHSLVALDYAKKEIYSFNNKQIDEGIELLSKASLLVGHNIISFDLPALQKVMNFKPKCQIFDTLNVSRLIYPDQDIKDQEKKMYPKKLWGKHSLEAWGIRLGIHKGNFGKSTDWSEWSQEMQDYCEQDVHVTAALYDKILSYNRYDRIQRAIGIEHEFQKIIHNQEVNGILFDVEKAKNTQTKSKQILRQSEQGFSPEYRFSLNEREALHLKEIIQHWDIGQESLSIAFPLILLTLEVEYRSLNTCNKNITGNLQFLPTKVTQKWMEKSLEDLNMRKLHGLPTISNEKKS